MPATATAVFAIVVIAFVLASRRIGSLQLTAPIVFTAVGAGVSTFAEGDVEPALLRSVAEVALAVVLFHDAAQVKPRQIRTDAGLVARLLLLGLPLTILLGLGTAWLLFPTIGVWLALLLASALAPTDAGLGAPTVLNPVVPVRVRRLLNVESGLNDGLATPVVLFAIAAVAATGADHSAPVLTALEELAIGLAVGIVLGGLVGYALVRLSTRGWVDTALVPVATVMVPLLTYFGAVALHGNGFVAVFVSGTSFAAGLARRTSTSVAPEAEESLLLTEWVSMLLGYLVWALFGFVAVNRLVPALAWQGVVFAVLSLTVLRMLPVALSLLGTGLRTTTVAFLGWFGPRGLASVVFAVLAVESLPSTPELDLVLGTVVLTIVLSVVLHGITAGPWAARYGAWAQHTDAPVEHEPSVEPAAGRARWEGMGR